MSAWALFAEIASEAAIGIAILDSELRVCDVCGVAAMAGLRPGAPACEAGPLAGLEESLVEMQAKSAATVHLPNLSIASGQDQHDPQHFSIRLFWSGASRKYFVLILEEEDNVRIMRSVVQDERRGRIEREQMQAILNRVRSIEFMYQDVVEKSRDMIVRTDETGTIVFANAAALRSANSQSGHLRDCGLDMFFPGTLMDPPWPERLQTAKAAGLATFESETVENTGLSRWYNWTVTWLGAEGMRQFQLVAHDVTDARMLEMERMRASRNALSAAISNERFRIARDLHDTLVRAILSVHAQLRLIGRLWPSAGRDELKSELALAEETARSGVTAAREAIFEMRLELSPDHPFGAMVKRLADNATRRANLDIAIAIPDELHAAHDRQTEGVYRIVSEAIRNIEQHAQADKVTIRIAADAGAGQAMLTAMVEDNGIGFDTAMRKPMHFGLTGMIEQAKQLGGELDVRSSPGRGTAIVVKIPRRFDTSAPG